MAFWIFKYRPENYNLRARLSDPSPTLTWTVSRFRDEIAAGDTAFLWETGPHRGIRAVMRIDEPPREMPELDSERRYWVEPDVAVAPRVLGTLTHRGIDLPAERLRRVPGLDGLSVFHGFQQGTNFPVAPEEGRILKALVEGGGELPAVDVPRLAGSPGATFAQPPPTFEVGRIYNRRTDLHGRYGGQQQGGISTPSRVRCIFLFTGPSGDQHGYRDGWNDDGVFLYTGEGQSGDMQFVRGNLAIREHVADGRDLHLFESRGKGEGCRYLGRFDCAGSKYGRAPDTSGQDRQVIVFHLLPEGEAAAVEMPTVDAAAGAPATLQELRTRALAAVHPPGERPAREARRLYYERSNAVREYVLARATGVCEACKKPAPFVRPDGTPYLEPHHTRRLADGGPDHPLWVGGICPTCHREIHHGEHGPEVNRRLEEYLRTIEGVQE
jgi:5-methylcytosine-specific restriction protein A